MKYVLLSVLTIISCAFIFPIVLVVAMKHPDICVGVAILLTLVELLPYVPTKGLRTLFSTQYNLGRGLKHKSLPIKEAKKTKIKKKHLSVKEVRK